MKGSAAFRWRRASSAALSWGNRGVACDFRKILPVSTQPCGDEVVVQQQARRWRWKTSALALKGPSAALGTRFLYPSRVQQALFASCPVKGVDISVHEGDERLLHVIRCEAEDCTKRSLNIFQRNPPRPFVLVKDEPGAMEMTLNRIYGLEDISMSCVLQLVSKKYQRKPEVGEDPESRTKMLQLTISVKKSGMSPTLKIRCECYRDGFALHQVDLDDEELTVHCPYFSDRKEQLVNNFQIFLYDRGLNADLAAYIEKHLERKRLLKSAAVFEKMNKFLEADSSLENRTGE